VQHLQWKCALVPDARRRAAKERLISEATARISSAFNVENILRPQQRNWNVYWVALKINSIPEQGVIVNRIKARSL